MEAEMVKRYRVTLTPEERAELERMIGGGKAAARKLAHARILLKADEAEGGPGWGDGQIAESVEVGPATVARVRERFVEQGLGAALVPTPTARSYARKLDGAGEVRLAALACTKPPAGRKRWTLALLADRLVALGVAESLSYVAVHRALKKRAETVAAGDVVHPPGAGLRVRGGHGGRAGGVRPAVRPQVPASVSG
jgi:Homeodomain-like domain